ncbi:MAG: hypothetical protein ACI9O3_000651, partial [Colwellia sp.]
PRYQSLELDLFMITTWLMLLFWPFIISFACLKKQNFIEFRTTTLEHLF